MKRREIRKSQDSGRWRLGSFEWDFVATDVSGKQRLDATFLPSEVTKSFQRTHSARPRVEVKSPTIGSERLWAMRWLQPSNLRRSKFDGS